MTIITPHMFIRQQDEYSCAAACLATVAAIYGVDKDYAFFRALVQPDPDTGTCDTRLVDACRAHLPFTRAGEGAYDGGVAIANVFDGKDGHYVVFLCAEGEDVVCYDPYHHRIARTPLSLIEWRSGSGALQKWSVNFTPLGGNAPGLWPRALD